MFLLIAVGGAIFLAAAAVKVINRGHAIKNPRLGILDLTGGDAAPLIVADKGALRDVFPAYEESNCDVPRCDVLFLYANIFEDERVEGHVVGLREIIRDSGAKVVVVASENSRRSCTNTGERKPYGKANLVITFSRRGEAFPRFFRELFTKMKDGALMPAAWVQLAPQIPADGHRDCPSTLFLCEEGKIRFRFDPTIET